MEYEVFKIEMTNAIKNAAGEEVEVHTGQVKKNNGIRLDAVSLLFPRECVAPTIYLNNLYEGYLAGDTIEQLAEYVVYISVHTRPKVTIPADFFMDYEQMRHRICYRLVNYEKNKESLEHMPHRRYLDLAVVYYYLIEPEVMPNASVPIRNEDLKRLGISEEQLAEDAEKNTPEILPWDFMKIHEMVEQISQRDVICYEEKEGIFTVMPMYVLTNKEKFLGAACLLYPDVLSEIAKELQSSFYVLPSSIHECIIMPESGEYSKESLSSMVAEINATQLDEVEVLQDHVYFYDQNTGILS